MTLRPEVCALGRVDGPVSPALRPRFLRALPRTFISLDEVSENPRDDPRGAPT